MRRGQKVVKTIKGEKKELEYLGKGQFTTAYKNGKFVYLFTNKSSEKGDWAKEAISLFCRDHTHIPDIWHVEELDSGITIYKTNYYEPLMAKHKEAWKLAKYLEEERWRLWMANFIQVRSRHRMWFEVMQEFIDTITVPESIKEALQELLYAGMNYDQSVAFEFNKKNLGVDEQGNLVFIDCLWFPERTWGRK